MTTLRLFPPDDWPSVWQILEPVFRAGETYPYSPNITEAEARVAWVDVPAATIVAVDDLGEVLGPTTSSPIRANWGHTSPTVGTS
ncbi:hypothetical protein K239x_28020 [Planctomycetes bacterium K23_9]|uniref:N-acetyltransferase domain-containing protein n=1 Tax=Stieleria marina TaxID=1930275 RepID=A0A517NUK8_9BACT|nr:hypothetical protein K239x_28020 [Planctomycetes bacterium K23_9]